MIIFLDFDGVLTTPNTKYQDADPVCLENLKEIITNLDAKLVISSTWKHIQDVIPVLERWGLIQYYLDVTPNLEVESNGVIKTLGKEYEIYHWLRDNPDYEYLILDDEYMLNDDLMRHLLKIDGEKGVQDWDIARASLLYTILYPKQP